MRLQNVAALFGLILLASTAVGPARADPVRDRRDETLAAIRPAGEAAGMARACGVDPTPITSALQDLLQRSQLAQPAVAGALRDYHESESRMTKAALAVPGPLPCGDIHSLLRDTVRLLGNVGESRAVDRDQ